MDMITLNYNGHTGTTSGRRKDGSRAVQWEDNQIEWFSADEFENVLQLSTYSTLAEVTL